ncbi:MAG: hypothetical protein V1702_06400 [Candidatus Woesearchaeota archaeon]
MDLFSIWSTGAGKLIVILGVGFAVVFVIFVFFFFYQRYMTG